MRPILIAVVIGVFGVTAWAVDVAPTDALPADAQRQLFHLPPGFEIQLVVSEPQIGQPMNLNFDARGRLWVTSSIEYPYPAQGDLDPRSGKFAKISDHPPGDWLTIVTDIGEDGHGRSTHHFADGLNIPIGQVPLGTGNQAIVYDIPSIRRFVDTDNDGRSDTSSVLYTRFGHSDTHGMVNSFTRGVDGWIYGCHGFSNTSKVTDADGHVTELFSGNTVRFRADGSRFERFTAGQVNPFGITMDPLGNIYDADCHSMPLFMLLRGASYPRPSWAKPQPDSLGSAPNMIDHNHGSTGICGPAYYAAEQFPPDYRDMIYLCNPVTGRVHRDKLNAFGSTNLVESQPDFITCDDPWFRPVDAKVGPDGALYIADFYNAVIGHYEVPLEHEKRDRTHGRVWRIVYRGEKLDNLIPPLPDLTALSLPDLVQKLADPNLVVRTLALNLLVDQYAAEAGPVIRLAMASGSPALVAHGMWLLERTGGIDDALLGKLAGDNNRLPRINALKILAERPSLNAALEDIVLSGLADDDAIVRRAAADALTVHVAAKSIQPLLAATGSCDKKDTHLLHVLRMALRTQLAAEQDWQALAAKLSPNLLKVLNDLAPAVPTTAAADYLVSRLDAAEITRLAATKPEKLVIQIRSAVPTLAGNPLNELTNRLRQARLPAELQLDLLAVLPANDSSRDWGLSLARTVLQSVPPTNWQTPSAMIGVENPWVPQSRRCADGSTAVFWSSLPNGEQRTGTLRSAAFTVPATLSFQIAGHDNLPSQALGEQNFVILRDAATLEELVQARPPRNDIAQPVVWDLTAYVGRTAVLDLVDGHSGKAYAWLAAGRFSLPELAIGQIEGDLTRRTLELAVRLNLSELLDSIQPLITNPQQSATMRAAAAKAVMQWSPKEALPGILTAMAAAPAAIQQALALATSTQAIGAEASLAAIESGTLSRALLQDRQLVENLRAANLTNGSTRLEKLLAQLPAADSVTAALIEQRRHGYANAHPSPDRGRTVFTAYCTACHRIDGSGGDIGPSLDGIGNRGLARLLEDILDPDRNIDPAFAATTITQKDGTAVSGIGAKQEDTFWKLTDNTGRQLTIATADILQAVHSPLSLMPAAMTRAIPEEQFFDLLAFLLTKKTDAGR